MLYIVVRPDENQADRWKNDWIDNHRVACLPTTAELAHLCQEANERGERVRFHRCAYGASGALICAEARVAGVQKVDRTMWLVRFDGHTVLRESPRVTPAQGDTHYRA